MMKQLISFLLLSMACALSILPAMADFTKSYNSGGIYYMLDTKNKTAQIVQNEAHKNLTTLNLSSLVVYNSDSYDITDIGANAFANCTKLTSANIPSKVTTIASSAFSGCSNLTTVMYEAACLPTPLLSGAKNITEFTLGAFYTGGTTIGTWFKGNTSLQKFKDNSNNTQIAADAFNGCTSLQTFSASRITTIGNRAFKGCTNLTSASCGTSVATIGEAAFQSCSKLPSFPFYASLTSIGKFAFQFCFALTKADLSRSKITTLPPYAFGSCTSLESCILPSTVTTIEAYALRNNNKLSSFTIPQGVSVIEPYAFDGCDMIETLVVPSSYTSEGNTTLVGGSFHGMNGLKSIDLSKTSLKSVTITDLKSLTTVLLPSTCTNLSLRGCTAITNVNLQDTHLTTIGTLCFYNCTNLKHVTLPNTVTTIGSGAFSGSSIVSIEWPSQATAIPASCFENCKSLTAFLITNGTKSIGANAFNGCDALTNVETAAYTAPSLETDAFKSTTLSPANRTLQVPAQSYDAYVSAGYGKYFTLTMPAPTSLTVSPKTLTLYARTKSTILKGVVSPSKADPTLSWRSTNLAVAQVNANGVVTPLSAGTANIIATTPNGLKDSCSLTVNDVTSISLAETKATIILPTTLQLQPTVSPAEADQTITWESTNPNVATVSATGLVSSREAGTATIIATTGNGLTTQCDITVEKPLVRIDYNAILLKPNTSQTLNASFEGGVNWSSEDPSIATVDPDGKVTAVSEGTVVITATGKTNAKAQAKCLVTVSNEDFIYVGNIYYLPIEGQPGHLEVTNMGLGQESNYAADADRTEYSATVSIPPTLSYNGTNYTVSRIGRYAFYRMKDLQMVVVPNTIETIGDHAFERSEKMVRISFATDSKLETIGQSAFRQCAKLDYVTLPNSVKSVGASAFMNCSSLTKLTLSTGMTDISPYLCYHCDVLNNVVLPDGIKVVGQQAFRHCAKLCNITYSANLSMIDEYAFANCDTLQVVDLPAKVAAIQNYAFCNNPRLYRISIQAGIEGIGAYSFANCPKLESATFAFTKPITIGESAFIDCKALTKVNIMSAEAWVQTNFANALANPTYYSKNLSLNGTPLTVLNLGSEAKYINQYALANCNKLTSVTLPASVSAVSDCIFAGCDALTTVKVDATVPPLFVGTCAVGNSTELRHIALSVPSASAQAYQTNSYWGLYSTINGQTSTIEPADSTKTIEFARRNIMLKTGENIIARIVGAFTGSAILWQSSNPSVASINADGMIKAATEGTAIITATLIDNPDVKGKMLIQVSNTTPAYVGSIYYNITTAPATAAVTNMGAGYATSYPFDTDRYDYSGIIEVPQTVTYAGQTVTVNAIDPYAFYEMTDLQKCIIPASIERIATRAFEEADHMQRIEFAQGSKLSAVAERAFYNCLSLDCVSLPAGLHTIDKSVFRYCEALKTITLPSALSMIDEYAFANCTALPTITLPATLNSIQNYGFAFSSALREITIPESLIGIGAYCFRDCEQLQSIRFANTRAMTIGESAFEGCEALRSTYVDNLARYVETNFYNEMANPTYFSKYIGQNGKELREVVVPAAASYINQYALVNCKNVTTVDLPANILTVSDHIFMGCANLSKVICRATVPPAFIGTRNPLDMIAIIGDADRRTIFERTNLFVPADAIESYQTDDYWKLYHNIADLSSLNAGDVNQDNTINAADAVSIYNYIMGGDTSGISLDNADVNGDSTVNAADVVSVYNIITGGK